MKSLIAAAYLETQAFRGCFRSGAPKRICHFHELFVRSNGDVFPCCQTWERQSMRIGHVGDADIAEKISRFSGFCSCDRFRLKRGGRGDERKYSLLNIELSLLCQGQCAMCGVNSPGWQGEYDLYRQLDALVDVTQPAEILVQGGEVLVQKRSVEWLKALKSRHPSLKISLVTNGCVPEETADAVDGLFSRVTVSFVGFQRETYRRIMGLDIDRTFVFVDRLLRMKETKVYLKYLVTPINVHETPLFLQWAIEQAPARIAVSDATMQSYIRHTPDDYWRKIFDRTGADARRVLVDNLAAIKEGNIILSLDQMSRTLLGIGEEFIRKNDLSRHVDWT